MIEEGNNLHTTFGGANLPEFYRLTIVGSNRIFPTLIEILSTMEDTIHDKAQRLVLLGGGSVLHSIWAPPLHPVESDATFTLPHQDPVVLHVA